MTDRDRQQGAGGGTGSPGLRGLGNPLDFLVADNGRKRRICTLIETLADEAAPDPMTIDAVLDYLGAELPLHMADEDADLFALMRRRCGPEDGIGAVLAQLQADHLAFADLAPELCALLQRADADPAGVTDADRDSLRDFARRARRHLGTECAIVLPLARARLTDTDLATLGLRMLQRRGLDKLLGGGMDAR